MQCWTETRGFLRSAQFGREFLARNRDSLQKAVFVLALLRRLAAHQVLTRLCRLAVARGKEGQLPILYVELLQWGHSWLAPPMMPLVRALHWPLIWQQSLLVT